MHPNRAGRRFICGANGVLGAAVGGELEAVGGESESRESSTPGNSKHIQRWQEALSLFILSLQKCSPPHLTPSLLRVHNSPRSRQFPVCALHASPMCRWGCRCVALRESLCFICYHAPSPHVYSNNWSCFGWGLIVFPVKLFWGLFVFFRLFGFIVGEPSRTELTLGLW